MSKIWCAYPLLSLSFHSFRRFWIGSDLKINNFRGPRSRQLGLAAFYIALYLKYSGWLCLNSSCLGHFTMLNECLGKNILRYLVSRWVILWICLHAWKVEAWTIIWIIMLVYLMGLMCLLGLDCGKLLNPVWKTGDTRLRKEMVANFSWAFFHGVTSAARLKRSKDCLISSLRTALGRLLNNAIVWKLAFCRLKAFTR